MDVSDMIDWLIEEKDNVILELRRELAEVKAVERKLWATVAWLQKAAGEANGWVTVGTIPESDDCNDFGGNLDRAGELLDGIVALTPAE